MKFSITKTIAASIPAALLAGSGFVASAAPAAHGPIIFRNFNSFGVRPFATGATVLGGGATLPIPGYLGLTESSGTTNFGKAGSIFGYFATVSGGLNVEYCATGSGKGKGVFDGTINTVDTPCSNAASSTATTFGFLPPSGSPTQSYPTLAGTDAPLAASDYSLYTSNHPAPQEPVELPSIFGSIAIYYHDNALGASHARITLNNQQICGVFNGTYKTFGALLGTSDTTPITPIYRSDGSGTSFNFSDHLAYAPGASNCTHFGANQTFASADPTSPTPGMGANGNSGVIAAVQSINGAIGYVEAGYLTDSPSGVGEINYANVTNPTTNTAVDPFAGLPAAANSVTLSALGTNDVVNQTLAGQGGATTSPITVRQGNCLKVVTPKAYSNPSTGYPIVAVTYLLINYTSGTQASSLQTLETILNTPSNFKHPGATTHITTVDEAEPGVTTGTTGYSSLGSAFNSTLIATAKSCITTNPPTP